MSDTISRRDAFHVLDNCRFASEQEKKYAYSLMEQVASAQPEKRTDKRTETHACDCISRQAMFETVAEYEKQLREIYGDENELVETVKILKHRLLIDLPSAQPETQPYVVEIESEYKKWVSMSYIDKPLAKALYEVWKKHDREDVSRNG